MTDRCTGHCCEDVAIYLSPEELADSYQAWLARGHYDASSYSDFPGGRRTPSQHSSGKVALAFRDIHLIFPMLTFIRKDHHHPDDPSATQDQTVYHYQCKHFNKEEKVCSIYSIRPSMCRAYGHSGCGYSRCTWKEAADRRKATQRREPAMEEDEVRKEPQ